MSSQDQQEQLHAVLGALAVFDDDQNGIKSHRSCMLRDDCCTKLTAFQAKSTEIDCEKFY
jgi:hypothetical protein